MISQTLDGIENSLDAGIELPESLPILDMINDLPDIFGVSRVHFSKNHDIIVHSLQSQLCCERSWKRDASVAKREDGSILSERDYNAIKKNH